MIKSIQNFKDARLRAMFGSIYAKLTQKDDRLTSLQEVINLAKPKREKYLGLQTIPIENIIGSEGRYDDFNKEFLPKKESLEARWAAIDNILTQQGTLPPIEVYKVDDYYFVRDGNHRVSVAKSHKWGFIDAEVTEYIVNVSITKDLTPKDKLMIQEHANFLDVTQLSSLGKGADIKLTLPESYQKLLRIIHHYSEFQAREKGIPLSITEAAKQWYQSVFLPFAEEAYLDDMLSRFPNRTTGDLYVWVQNNWVRLRESYGEGMSFLDQGVPEEFQDKEKVSESESNLLKEKLPEMKHSRENRFLNSYIGMVTTGVLLHINYEGEIWVAMVKRKYHPFEGFWSLPIAVLGAEETRFACAQRCFSHALGVNDDLKLVHFQTFDGVDRTPFGRIISFGMLGIHYGENLKMLAGGIASSIKLEELDDIPQLVYDHNEIVVEAYRYLYRIRNNFSFIKELFPDEIPLKHIRTLFRRVRKILHEHEDYLARKE